MNPVQQKLLIALAEFWELFPSFRLGQMICNLTSAAKSDSSFANPAGTIWDIEDEEMLTCIEEWVARRRAMLDDDKVTAAELTK